MVTPKPPRRNGTRNGQAKLNERTRNAYYGKTSILGTPYVSGYEPIKDASGATIGVYFVGYTK